jgi:23S rRNA (guanine1835-N2)-methyltransferase
MLYPVELQAQRSRILFRCSRSPIRSSSYRACRLWQAWRTDAVCEWNIMARHKSRQSTYADLIPLLGVRLRPPFGIVLGAPGEAARLAAALPSGDAVAYQMDMHSAERLSEALVELGSRTRVQTAADLWDLPAAFQTLLYPAAKGGERELKIDMVQQAFHTLRPGGILAVLSPYRKDDFFPPLLKKVFGRVHAPISEAGTLFWCRREGDRPLRRHEITFQVRLDERHSARFLSRPGTFAYGRFDDGARALVGEMQIRPGDRVLDVGCGCGTNGVIAGLRAGATGHVAFVDSNVRALALAEHNARENGVTSFETVASSRVEGLPENSFDVALANPPYMAQGTVAGLFTVRSRSLLKPGGRFYLVTRQPHEVAEIVTDVFGRCTLTERGGYSVFSARA